MGPVVLFALVLYTYADLGTKTIRYFDTTAQCQTALIAMEREIDPYKAVASCVMVTIPKE